MHMTENSIAQGHSESSGRHVIIIFLLAFLTRLLLGWYLLGLDWRYETGDGYEDALFLKHVLSQTCYMPPGQYLFAGLINQFFSQPNYLLLRIAIIILSALVSTNIYKIGKENFGSKVGIISGYSSVLSFTFIFHSWTFYPTTLAACLFSFFTLHFLRMLRSGGSKNALLAGLFLGLSALTRAEKLLLLPVSLFWFILVKKVGRQTAKLSLGMLSVCLLVVSCWTVRNYLVCSEFSFLSSNGPVNFFIGNNPLQKGGYFLPPASQQEKDNYFLSGLVYDLKHPGWCVRFFKKKFLLYWSDRTWEHPGQLLERRFENSSAKLFNDKFNVSRLGRFIENPRLDRIYGFLVFLYDYIGKVFWFFLFLGLFGSSLHWQKAYFLITTGLTHAVVFSLFFSGSNSYLVPVLPSLYVLMGMGIVFVTTVPHLKRSEIKTLLWRNSWLLSAALVGYGLTFVVTSHPAEKTERIAGLRGWNVLGIREKSISLAIFESQLSYPVKTGNLTKEHVSVWIGKKEMPHREVADKTGKVERVYFGTAQDFLCTNVIIIDVPRSLVEAFFPAERDVLKSTIKEQIAKRLDGKITIRYTPAWQFRGWINDVLQYCLRTLSPSPS